MAALCIVGLGGWFYHTFFNDPFDDWWFDAKIWKSQHNKSTSDNPRGKMASDLKNRVIKPGMTKTQILQMLGPPDFSQNEATFTYNLGSWSGFRMDGDVFDVDFNKSGRVKSVGWGQL